MKTTQALIERVVRITTLETVGKARVIFFAKLEVSFRDSKALVQTDKVHSAAGANSVANTRNNV